MSEKILSATGGIEIATADLRLVAATPELLEADLRGWAGPEGAGAGSPLCALIGAEPPPSWPPELFEKDDIERTLAFTRQSGRAEWGLWYMISRAPMDAQSGRGMLVGIIGFGGPPDEAGDVTIGYSVIAAARRRGFASQATAALALQAFGDPRTRSVSAETFAELTPSIGVLEKCGFRRSQAEPTTPGAIRFVRRRE